MPVPVGIRQTLKMDDTAIIGLAGTRKKDACLSPQPTATFLLLLFDGSKQKSRAETIYIEKESGSLEKN